MVMNASKSFLFSLAKRHYAAAASPKAASCSSKEVQVTTLPNKMRIASMESPLPGLCKVAVAIKAGSRYEKPDNLGVSHILRSSAGLTTKCASHFAISKNIQQIGATFSATSDRETIVYMLETNNENVECGLQYLKYAMVGQEFRPWELTDNIPRIKYEIAIVPPQVKVIDMLHKAAYRTGLGNSIFVKKYNIKKIGTETLQHFVATNFLTNRTSVAGVGIDHNTLMHFGEALGFSCEEGETSKAKYYGGEMRKDTNSHLAYAIIAGESAGLNKKEVFAYAVLRHALGTGPSTKRGVGCSPLCKAVANSLGPATAQALAMAHADSGLFGVLISCSPEDANNVVLSVMKALKAGVTDSDVNRAKAQLTSQLLYCSESADTLLNDIVNQCALMGGAKSPAHLLSDIAAVTTSEVQQALQKIVSGKKSMAAIGSIHNVPYLADII
uniref:Putative cytochrome b-c1 complex subunit 2 mitochondrial-like isoform x2 n=1 Tax=Panstrongylus megistus TaxID=65343 RepID=A0A069DU18_9HEMI